MTWATDDIFVAGGDFVREYWADFQAQASVTAVVTVSAEGPVAYLNPLPWAALWLPVDDEAGYSLVGSALVNGHRRIIVFNGARSMEERRSEGVRLMRAAFADYGVRRFAEPRAEIGEAEVYLGARKTVPLVSPNLLAIGGSNAVLGELHAHIRYNGPLTAPIKKGDLVAHLVIDGPPGFVPRTYPLAAGADIGRANWFSRAAEGLHLTLSGAH